jgi:hypothetical protein
VALGWDQHKLIRRGLGTRGQCDHSPDGHLAHQPWEHAISHPPTHLQRRHVCIGTVIIPSMRVCKLALEMFECMTCFILRICSLATYTSILFACFSSVALLRISHRSVSCCVSCALAARGMFGVLYSNNFPSQWICASTLWF